MLWLPIGCAAVTGACCGLGGMPRPVGAGAPCRYCSEGGTLPFNWAGLCPLAPALAPFDVMDAVVSIMTSSGWPLVAWLSLKSASSKSSAMGLLASKFRGVVG